MEHSEPTYVIEKEKVWRSTLEQESYEFADVQPAIKEMTHDQIKKDKEEGKIELSEANVFKSFPVSTMKWVTNKLYYVQGVRGKEDNKFYNLIDYEKSEDGKIISCKLLSHKGKDEKVLTDPDEISLLRDYININLRIYSETGSGQMASVPIKLQNKLSTELGEHVEAITEMSFGLFKFFRGSTIIDGDKFLSSYQDIEEDMEIIGAAGFSKPYKFMRFKSTYEWPHWGYNRSTVDAACWIPNKNVILYGFSVYAACEPQFNLSFKVYINDTIIFNHIYNFSIPF